MNHRIQLCVCAVSGMKSSTLGRVWVGVVPALQGVVRRAGLSKTPALAVLQEGEEGVEATAVPA